jgi:hypothetical protein
MKETARVRVLATDVVVDGKRAELDEVFDFHGHKLFSTNDSSLAIDAGDEYISVRRSDPRAVLMSSSRLFHPKNALFPQKRQFHFMTPGKPTVTQGVWPITLGLDPNFPSTAVFSTTDDKLVVSYLGHPYRDALQNLRVPADATITLRNFTDHNGRQTAHQCLLFQPFDSFTAQVQFSPTTSLFPACATLFLEIMYEEQYKKTGKARKRAPRLFRVSLATQTSTQSDHLIRVKQAPWHCLAAVSKNQRRAMFRRTAEVLVLPTTLSESAVMSVEDVALWNDYIRQSYDCKPTDEPIMLMQSDQLADSGCQIAALTQQIQDLMKSIKSDAPRSEPEELI